MLYVLVFKLLYSHFKKSMKNSFLFSPTTQEIKKNHGIFKIFLTIFITLVLIAVIGIGLLSSGISYLGYVFSTFGIVMLVALISAFTFAYMTFKEVEQTAIEIKDASLLASFFWIGLSLILLYHIMWVVLMITLVNIWPFNTYTPK